ncbi:CLUMA_CG018720, isoform A [Clunio marinus]|uniref:CLUMA_CG018720, isoform A n=1 Tax=Clunio marinus TaxID=568069 RepID=A0A1J1J033_9DIPT|nr:CLUMA_CG018720, isoform A [Clunio marinus]
MIFTSTKNTKYEIVNGISCLGTSRGWAKVEKVLVEGFAFLFLLSSFIQHDTIVYFWKALLPSASSLCQTVSYELISEKCEHKSRDGKNITLS